METRLFETGFGETTLAQAPGLAARLRDDRQTDGRSACDAKSGENAAADPVASDTAAVVLHGVPAMLVLALAGGVLGAPFVSLDARWPDADSAQRLRYGFEWMRGHGKRRAAEMEGDVATLGALGTGSTMSRATVRRHREMDVEGASSPTRATAIAA